MNNIKRLYVFSPSLRIWHWINFLSIIVLFATGIYIGNPFFIGSQGIEPALAHGETLTMGLVREVHFIAGYILLASFIFRILIALTSKRDRLFIPKFWTAEYWFSIFETVQEYLLLKSSKEVVPHVRNHLARTAYFFIYLAIFFMIVTGFAMYGLSDPEGFWASIFGWVVWALGGEFPTHMWHHWIAWIIILFAIVHVYMVVREDIVKRDGEISSMFSGYKFFKKEPFDAEDLK